MSERSRGATEWPTLMVVLTATLAACAGSTANPPIDPARPDGAGEFGLVERPANPTCKPPARYTAPADTLSATGCVDPKDPHAPAPGLIPYEVASPLWSDGASKRRFFALPDGARVHVKDCGRQPDTCRSVAQGGTPDDDGHFEFPVGTVLMKHFAFASRIFETRLFVRWSDTRWVGYSYAWDADGRDAHLVSQDGEHRNVSNDAGAMQGWAFPSQSDCLLCHNDAAGFALGLELRQVNFDLQYPSGVTSNQLATLEHIGVFDGPIAARATAPEAAPFATPSVPETGTLEARTRSYLHANCGICHRPEGKFPGLDLRAQVPLAAMGICQTDSTKGTAGAIGPAQRLVPGHPEQSTLYTRVATLDPDVRMPQLATSIVDPTGTPLVADWIKSISACPPAP